MQYKFYKMVYSQTRIESTSLAELPAVTKKVRHEILLLEKYFSKMIFIL